MNRIETALITALVTSAVWTAGHALAETAPKSSDAANVISEAFLNTDFDRVECDGFGPLCQVVAGKTVFYVDPEARHAFIGRLYDLSSRTDLTAATLERLAPAETARAPIEMGEQGALGWDDLPLGAAILRHPGAPRKLAVFSDLNCGYCERLNAELKAASDIEVHEFLIGRIGSAEASRVIGCATDPAAAMDAYYATRDVPQASCDRDIVAPARAAAARFGVRGTPSFVRADGAVLSGFTDLPTLRAWIDAQGSTPSRKGDPK